MSQSLAEELPAESDELLSQLNQSHDYEYLVPYDPWQRNLRGSLMIAMSIVSISLNFLLFRQTRNRRVTTDCNGNHSIILHLSVANFLTAIFCLLTKGIWDIVVVWYLGDTMCKLINGIEKFALYANTYLVVILSLHRVINFKCTGDSITVSKKRSRRLIAGAWAFSGVCAVPQVFGHTEQFDHQLNNTVCQYDMSFYGKHSEWANYLEGCVHVVLLYFVPVAMIIASSSILLGAILKRMKRFGLREEEIGEKRHLGVTASFASVQNNSSSSTAGNTNNEVDVVARRVRERRTEIVTVTHYLYPRAGARPSSCSTLCASPVLLTYRNGQVVSFATGSAVSAAETHELLTCGMLRQTRPAHGAVDLARATVLFQRAKLRSIQVAATTVGCYVLCWTPYYVFQLVIYSIADASHNGTVLFDAAAWLYVVGLAYIIVHPLLYGAVTVRCVRRRLRKLCVASKRKNVAANFV